MKEQWVGLRRSYSAVWLLFAFLLLIALSTGAAIYKNYELADFDVFFQTDCDPSQGSCFAVDNESCEADDPTLCQNTFALTSVAHRKLACNPDHGECLERTCSADPSSCRIIECSTEYIEYFGIAGRCIDQ